MRNPLIALGAMLIASCAALSTGHSKDMVYVVEASGGAWGAAVKARAAMNSVDGIDELHMSGARAVFVLAQGSDLDEEAIAAAFDERGMKLETLERTYRPRQLGVVTVDTGVTWAATAARVRAALMERTGAIDVYFEEQVEILVADPEEFSVDTASEVLTGLEIEFSEIEVSL